MGASEAPGHSRRAGQEVPRGAVQFWGRSCVACFAGTSSSVKMATNGKILGISGILGGAVFTHKADSAWQVTFLGE